MVKKTSVASIVPSTEIYTAKNRIRVLTAASLFDGHDAAINVMRRVIQASGAEVIHLGHNRSVHEIFIAALQEDVQAVALTSYQGGHNEFFKYLYDQLASVQAGHIKIFGGGGGVIIPEEIADLEDYGICKIFSPEDGRQMGLQGMINFLLEQADFNPLDGVTKSKKKTAIKEPFATWMRLARHITQIESGKKVSLPKKARRKTPVLGVTGTGGAGKSSLVDEFLLRYQRDFPDDKICVLSVDPSKRKTGGALLGDRIRMNSVYSNQVFMRSLATRGSASELGDCIQPILELVQGFDFDLIVLETSGIGQADAGIVGVCDFPLYVMTADFGAPTQLEKIDMIDFAQAVAINKFDRRGSEDALRDVRRQYRRSRRELDQADMETFPIFGTRASHFNDEGVTRLYRYVVEGLGKTLPKEMLAFRATPKQVVIPEKRVRYLSEIAECVRDYHRENLEHEKTAMKIQSLRVALREIDEQKSQEEISRKIRDYESHLPNELLQALNQWPKAKEALRSTDGAVAMFSKSLSQLDIPRIALPKTESWADILRFLTRENIPGQFPFTAGVFAFKRKDEEPRRQFAGEGGPERTNKRFHYLSRNDDAKRLSTAFDSVTLYGMDPDTRPDIYGKVGESGVSICSLRDMEILYRGFDLVDPKTSVSMTINGPAPMLLAMYFNTAINQQCAQFEKNHDRKPTAEEFEKIKGETLKKVRGTVQADILKEDQAQNTCIFSTEFALRMMGDIQQYFSQQGVRYYYSVSISGYHIAEAGANPISQLAFTLSNGFTYVEYYLSRGLSVDDFAHNLSFFFSNGLDPEYTVMGRVARRIWAVAMKNIYGGNERSQKLKYHIQTSGRSLHAQEIDFNDIRTTLQALMALYDHCNSLHTNAYDEAITTPTESSVRRAMAIQMIIERELGTSKCDNPWQGAYLVDELTDLVEEAVLQEFERISNRGGVLGAMEVQYQRGKIQDESLVYERQKHSGELPLIGVNTFVAATKPPKTHIELARSNEKEKSQRLKDLEAFHKKHAKEAPEALRRLKEVALSGENIFAELMNTVRVASLGQITRALFEVGGQFRRSM